MGSLYIVLGYCCLIGNFIPTALFNNMPQNFAKSLLDVADNLGRASSVVQGSFSKIDVSNDTAGAVPLLKTLLEGVEMTEKQLAEVNITHYLINHHSAAHCFLILCTFCIWMCFG